MIETNVNNKTVITYQYARFYKRVLANVIDMLLFLLCFGLLFISVRAIVNNSSYGVYANNELDKIRLDSGLYVRMYSENNQIVDIITYNDTFDPVPSQKRNNALQAIDNFFNYCSNLFNNVDSQYYEPSKYEMVYDSYLSFFQNKDLIFTKNNISVTYFLLDELDSNGKVIENPLARELGATYQNYYDDCYTPFINEILQGYLITIIPNYYEFTKFSSDMLFFVEIPISYLISGVIIYFIPTLIFRRGRKTFGKAIYKIGLVNKNLLNPSFGISFARFIIFYFTELILSLFTFCIPFIISFTLMVFSKKKQGFCDYMLNLCEVDTTNMSIFYDEKDALISNIEKPLKNVNFKNRDLS